MAKDPAFLFYSKDWIEGTSEFTHQEKGVYIDLLAHQHQKGSLPTDIDRLALIVGIPVDEFSKIWDYLSCKFELESLPNGNRTVDRLVNRKLERVTSERSINGAKNKLIGTWASVLRKLPHDQQIQAKKLFNVDDLIKQSTEWNTERLTEWLTERLGKGNRFIEDANEDVIVNSKVPTLLEVEQYFVENGYSKQAAKKAYAYYETSRSENGRVWKDSKGKSVKNWKQKMNGVWFTEENKIKKQQAQYNSPIL